ncbi:hypothetical protein ABZ436_24215 [Micromonospora matsumotoense]|uniref:hypothetical protein n=1 Tax=Micromonospora matsumotoense TaxID=121616 RepID=UPI0033DCCCF3
MRVRVGPTANWARMSSSVTVREAASKLTGFGSSLITFQPVTAQRLVSHAARTACCSSGAHANGTPA